MFKRSNLAAMLLVLAVFGFGGVSTLRAAPMLTGGFAKFGSFVPIGVAGTTVGLASATRIDFNTNGTTPTPGTAGMFLVTSRTGDFATLIPQNSIGKAKDFTFSGAAIANYPTVPISAFEVIPHNTSVVTVELKTVNILQQTSTVLKLDGTVIFTAAGYDPTPGTFIFTGNANGSSGAFSFSSSQGAVVPEPTTLSLLGLGLAATAWLSRRKQDRK